ncbi:MAG: hypothetical protein M3Q56_03220 [Bacteroidota bacterium]|nr:hypothetical protein [Bacteroidota bacterium]
MEEFNEEIPSCIINMKKNKPFEVPVDYFNSLNERILLKNDILKVKDLGIGSHEHFTIPEAYFENLSQVVLDKVRPVDQKPKVLRFSRMWVYSAAAAVILCLGLFIFEWNKSSSMSDPLANLTDDELYEYAVENSQQFDPEMLSDMIELSQIGEIGMDVLGESLDSEEASSVLELIELN